MKWHVGCSGFYYREWKGLFYPKGLAQKDWFAFYAEQFSTLEINATFYRFPTVKIFDNWYKKAPAHFIFSVKAPKIITHIQQFKETKLLIDDFYAIAAAGLKEKLGPVLFQLPPKFSYTDERLEAIVTQLNSSFLNVVEFRNESWWREDVRIRLAEKAISFCGVSYPGLPDNAVNNTPLSYYRFHGVPKLFYSEYEQAFIDERLSEIRNNDPLVAFLYFNNTASAAALQNANYTIKKLETID